MEKLTKEELIEIAVAMTGVPENGRPSYATAFTKVFDELRGRFGDGIEEEIEAAS